MFYFWLLTVDSLFFCQCLQFASSKNVVASSPFHQQLFPSWILVAEMFLCTYFPGFLFIYFCICFSHEKSLAFCEHCQASQSPTFICVKTWCVYTGLRQNLSGLPCIYSLSLRGSIFAVEAVLFWMFLFRAGLEAGIQDSQGYTIMKAKDGDLIHPFIHALSLWVPADCQALCWALDGHLGGTNK